MPENNVFMSDRQQRSELMADETNAPRETGSQSRGHTNGFLMKLDVGYRLSMCVCMRHEREQEGKRARR